MSPHLLTKLLANSSSLYMGLIELCFFICAEQLLTVSMLCVLHSWKVPVGILPKALLQVTALSCSRCHLALCKSTTSPSSTHRKPPLFMFLTLQLLLNAASCFTKRRNIENKNSCLPINPMALALEPRQESPFWNPPSPSHLKFGGQRKKSFSLYLVWEN